MFVMFVNRGERLAVLLRVSGVVPGQDLHHGPHLHPPLLLRPPEHEVRVLHQVCHGRERVESFPEAEQDGGVGLDADDSPVRRKMALSFFD